MRDGQRNLLRVVTGNDAPARPVQHPFPDHERGAADPRPDDPFKARHRQPYPPSSSPRSCAACQMQQNTAYMLYLGHSQPTVPRRSPQTIPNLLQTNPN